MNQKIFKALEFETMTLLMGRFPHPYTIEFYISFSSYIYRCYVYILHESKQFQIKIAKGNFNASFNFSDSIIFCIMKLQI